MSMDVSLRLRLQNQLSKDAKVAERDLRELGDAAKKVGSAKGADRLERGLKEVRTEAGRSERALREMDREARKLNTVKTDRAEREMKQLGRAAKEAGRDMDRVHGKFRDMGRVNGKGLAEMEGSAGRLNTNMGLLAASATGAFQGLVAFATVDNILRGLGQMSAKFRDLNRDVADVAVTLEMRTPEAMAKISASNEKLAMRYGSSQSEVNAARKAYAAAGIDLDSQEAILDPTMKAATAYSTDGETIAAAMIAAKQNLKIKDSEVPAALDMMAKGAKLGNFEVGAMAKNFPALGAMMAASGRTGLQGWGELVAMAQIARFSAGSEDDAATNLRNLLAKLSSEDTVKRFDDAGVSIESVKNKAMQEGKSYPMAVVDQVMKMTGGNQFRVNELFADQQAYLALSPLMENRQKYSDWLADIQKGGGLANLDAGFIHDTAQNKEARRDAALEATGVKIGEKWNAVSGPVKDWFIGNFLNNEYKIQENAYERRRTLMGEDPTAIEALIAEKTKQLGSVPKPKFGDVDALGLQRGNLEQEILTLKQYLDEVRRVQGADAVKDNGDLGKSTGTIPIPTPRPLEQSLGKSMGPAAEQAMQGYNERLSAEGDKAVAIATEKASQMQKALNFTATPTIVPQVVAPTALGEQHSSVQSNTGVKLTQHISSPNPRQAARLAARNQARAIRQAQANSFHDVGRRIT